MEFDEHCSLAALAAASSATDEGDIGRHYLDSRQLSVGGILAHLTHLFTPEGSREANPAYFRLGTMRRADSEPPFDADANMQGRQDSTLTGDGSS